MGIRLVYEWRGFDAMDNLDKQFTRSFDKILDQARLDRGIVLSRIGSARLLGLDHGRAESLSE